MTVEVPHLLFLHGYTQTGALFHTKTRAVQKALTKALGIPASNLHFPTGPHRLTASELPGAPPPDADISAADSADAVTTEYAAWWRRDDATSEYLGLDDTWAFLSEYLDTHGPFVGVVGFSQGAAMAAMLLAALEEGRAGKPQPLQTHHAPLRFGAFYSGFRALEQYDSFYEPKIRTPTLHVMGSMDAVVVEERGLALVEACEEKSRQVAYHPGGHYLPAAKQSLNVLIGFMQSNLKDGQTPEMGKVE